MDLGSIIAILGVVGILSYVWKDFIRNFFCGLVVKLHPRISVGDWFSAGRFGPKGRIKEFGIKYTYCETEDGKEILYENETIFNAKWIEKGKEKEEAS